MVTRLHAATARSDALRDGRRFRTLNVLDDYNRQAFGIEIDYSLPAGRVIRLLPRLIDTYGKPAKLCCDNGPRGGRPSLSVRPCANGVSRMALNYTGFSGSGRPSGKPTQNAYIERFNGSFRREVLDAYSFANLAQVREIVGGWLDDYNTKRPHQALNLLTPMEYKQAA